MQLHVVALRACKKSLFDVLFVLCRPLSQALAYFQRCWNFTLKYHRVCVAVNHFFVTDASERCEQFCAREGSYLRGDANQTADGTLILNAFLVLNLKYSVSKRRKVFHHIKFASQNIAQLVAVHVLEVVVVENFSLRKTALPELPVERV